MLQHGRKLYMQNCEHCHGVSGDGNGPTADYFDIKPRDYRLGIFKFTSTRNMDKARRDDLIRTVKLGIPGTYMPSFLLFTDEEVGSIIEYIRWLSMRGEFEQKVDVEFEAEQYTSDAIAQRRKGAKTQDQIDAALAKFIHDDLPRISSDKSDDLVTSWNAAEQPDALVVPKKSRTPDSPESRERGRKLFVSDIAKCSQCHGPAGKGNGPQTEDYQLIPGSTKKFSKPGLFDAVGPSDQAARPDLGNLPGRTAAARHLSADLFGDQGDAHAPLRCGLQGRGDLGSRQLCHEPPVPEGGGEPRAAAAEQDRRSRDRPRLKDLGRCGGELT